MEAYTEGELVDQLRAHVRQLETEMESLRLRLGELHCTDVNALRRAYKTLCQHVEALDQEARGMLEELQSMETEVVTPEVVASELGAASALAVGISVAHQALKATPLAGAVWLFRGMWALGGAYVAWRLTAGTLLRVAGMLSSNGRRKRDLEAKLALVEDRIQIMLSLLSWSEAKGMPPPTPSQQALHQFLHPPLSAGQQERQRQPEQQGWAAPLAGVEAAVGARPPRGAGAAVAEAAGGDAAEAHSAGSSSPVLVSAGEGSGFATPADSRSPSPTPSPPRKRAEGGPPGSTAGPVAEPSPKAAAAPPRSGSRASPAAAGGDGGGGASPSRPDFQVVMAPLMRYAQLGSSRGATP